MLPSGTTCLLTDCCFSKLALFKNPAKCVGLLQNLENITCSHHDTSEILLIWHETTI